MMPKTVAHFTKCPNCGGERQLATECSQEATEKPPGIPAMGAMMMPIVKTLSADVCPDCGTLYAKDILRQHAEMRVAPNQQFPGNGLVGGLN